MLAPRTPHALVLCAALTAGCGAAMVTTLPVAPQVASAARRPVSHAVELQWDATGEAITCGRTGTRVRVRIAGAIVRHASADAVDVASEAQALVVRANAGSFTDAALTNDLRDALAQLDAPLEHLELSVHVGIGTAPARSEIRASDSTHAASYELTYRVIQRNGVALRIALLSRTGAARVQTSLLASVDDSPGFDLNGGLARESQPATNAVWEILRALHAIDVFLHPMRARPPSYDVPPRVPSA